MSLTGKAISYLRKQFPNASFLKDIILQDDGNGPYIKYWGIGSPQPTEEELNSADVLPDIPVPTIEEQLHMIYLDMKNKTDLFVAEMDKHVK